MIYVKWFLRHLHAGAGAGCQAGQAGFVTWLYLCVNVAIFPPRSPGGFVGRERHGVAAI